jgi:two-component system sensor histidine kinase AtoS
LRGWLVVLADRTESERSEARERLAEGLAQLGELSAGVAHELRNGLAALTGWIELARRRPHSAETAECLDEIARESRLLARVVDDFLTFARPGTRRLERCDLCGVARRAASDPVFAPPGVRLELPAVAAELTGDPVLLERAVRNLVANAVEAVRAAGGGEPVELSVRPAAATWEIAVADRGQGVPAELAERLFQPFVSGRPGGVGLGLALARRIAVLHGGGLRLESRPGGGSRFVLTLPLETSDNSDT